MNVIDRFAALLRRPYPNMFEVEFDTGDGDKPLKVMVSVPGRLLTRIPERMRLENGKIRGVPKSWWDDVYVFTTLRGRWMSLRKFVE